MTIYTDVINMSETIGSWASSSYESVHESYRGYEIRIGLLLDGKSEFIASSHDELLVLAVL